MRFRIRTIMIAVVIVGLVTALAVLWWRAREEIRRAYVELQAQGVVVEDRTSLTELRVKVAEARAKSAEREVEELLRKSSHVDGDRDTSQKPPARQPSLAQ
jgi:hypothetical protein